MNGKEKTNNVLKESIIEENDLPYMEENDKKELLNTFSPVINTSVLNKNNSNIEYSRYSSKKKNEEYLDYKKQKSKLFNLYNELLEFRKKLILKEKELKEKEKNLLEFENILKSNEIILKNNIEQFDIYIKNKINEIKNQFNKIEQIQEKKENYLKQKEEEIFRLKTETYSLYDYNNINCTKCMNCNCDLCNEEKIIKPFIDNYLGDVDINESIHNNNNNDIHYKKINYKKKKGFYCAGCKNYFKKIQHQKNNSVNFKKRNSKFNNYKNNFIENSNDKEIHFNKKYINNTYGGSNDFNKYEYSCCCPGCEYCNL